MESDMDQRQEHIKVQERSTSSTSMSGEADLTRESSRDSLAGAGWICREVGRFRSLVPSWRRPFSWIDPIPLWLTRNQVLGSLLGDPTNDERRRWMGIQRRTSKLQPGLIIKEHAELKDFSFLVVGDTGEGDASQFAVVPPLLEIGQDTAFMVICSDVIYPSGDTEDYEDKFYRPYKDYTKPIYALPGNHDWYDGLNGFMYHLCEAEAQTRELVPESPTVETASRVAFWKERLRRWLWREPAEMDPTVPIRKQVWRSSPTQGSSQRSPYFAIETEPLLIVSIDTGMIGDIDREQGKWL